MTDIMKLAHEYAVRYRVNRAVDEARATLQSAIEALQAENSQLRTDLNAELQGNAAMRMRLGAKDGETMLAFAERLASQLDAIGKGEPVAHVYAIERTGRPLVAWDDAKGIGLGDKLYAAPKALAPSREVIGRYMADKGFYLSKEALDGLMLKLEGIGGTP